MLKRRIIACLDVHHARVVKGVNFMHMADAGDPVALAKRYTQEGVDELVFLDITATSKKTKVLISLVEQIAAEINIPFVVGGGISTIEDACAIMHAGADKISVNSSAVQHPTLIRQIADTYGSQAVIVAIDTKEIQGVWHVVTHGGHMITSLKTVDWAMQAEESGAGEILLTSMQHDGTRNGFALEITDRVSAAVNIPVIASGGAGSSTHFLSLFTQSRASAALAASIFHFGGIRIETLKNYLKNNNILVR